jgi:GNAT superfamily N-acetyltransferase
MEPHILRVRGESWDEEKERDRFSGIWNAANVMVIAIGDTPIGWLSADTAKDAVTLENFYIDSGYRGRGLGTAVLDWFMTQHRGRAVQTVVISGSRSRSLYERAGFGIRSEGDIETPMQAENFA